MNTLGQLAELGVTNGEVDGGQVSRTLRDLEQQVRILRGRLEEANRMRRRATREPWSFNI